MYRTRFFISLLLLGLLPVFSIVAQNGSAPNGSNSYPSIGIHGPQGQELHGNSWQNGLTSNYVTINGAGQTMLNAIDETNAKFVRLNILPCSGTSSNPDWSCYNNGEFQSLVSKGVQVYALFDAKSIVGSNLTNSKKDAFVQSVYNFVKTHKTTIRAIEIMNEPDHTGVGTWNFAYILDGVWKKIKNDSDWQVKNTKIISGPVMFDDGYLTGTGGASKDAAVNFVKNTVNTLKNNFGYQNWNLPFDGVGLHIYPFKCGNQGQPYALQGRIGTMLNDFWQPLSQAGIVNGNRKIWLSEFGFNNTLIQNDVKPWGVNTLDDLQAWYLAKGLETFKWHASKVEMVTVFSMFSFCAWEGNCSGGSMAQDWGLMINNNGANWCLLNSTPRKKRSHCVFQNSVAGWQSGNNAYNACSSTGKTEGNTELEMNEEISLYPNPVQDQLNVSLNKVMNEDLKIEILDVSGKVISETIMRPKNQLCSVNTTSLLKGIYLLRLSDEYGENICFYKFTK